MLLKKQNFPSPSMQIHITVRSGRRRRGLVGFARSKQGRSDGGCNRRGNIEQRSSQLEGSAEEGRPAVSSSGKGT